MASIRQKKMAKKEARRLGLLAWKKVSGGKVLDWRRLIHDCLVTRGDKFTKPKPRLVPQRRGVSGYGYEENRSRGW